MSKSATAFSVDGFEITATFADSHNTAAANHVNMIMEANPMNLENFILTHGFTLSIS